MKLAPVISILVPIYNAENYLKRCLDSILAQSFKDFEVILVNDGSSDNSGVIAEEYARKDGRIKVVHQQNSGPSMARNKGIALSIGDYIGFVDADDWLEPDMYQKMYAAVLDDNSDIVICGYSEVIGKVRRKHKLSSQIIKLGKSDIRNRICSGFIRSVGGLNETWNKLYKANIVRGRMEFDTTWNYGEDMLFNMEFFTHASMATILPDLLYNYNCSNSQSLMRKYRTGLIDIYYSIYKKANMSYLYRYNMCCLLLL